MLEFVIFVSGALIMVLEMVGARVMAPHLGTSVIVWTSLIGVVLACLACGAWLGGRLADKTLSKTILGRILAGAGAGCAFTALGHRFVGIAVTTSTDNIYLAAVLAAIGLFAFPAILFGMVSPYIIRLRLADLATSGATVGRLYALSTTGSIVGTFLGGFVLISFFSSTHILLGVAATMVLLSFLVWYLGGPIALMPRILILTAIPMIAMFNASQEQSMIEQGAPPPVETPYNNIRLMYGQSEGRNALYMATDPGYAQSGTYLDKPSELLFSYTKYYALGTVLFPHAEKVLMLGGGGYSVPKWLLAGHGGLNGEKLELDVVELDPGMTKLAKSSFGLTDDARMNIFHEDARRFINNNTKKYDLVFVDVFNSHYSVPFHMGTVEAVKAMHNAVHEHGAVLMNIISAFEGEDSFIFQGIYAALKQSFPHVLIFAVSPNTPLSEVQNFMVMAIPDEKSNVLEVIQNKSNTFSTNITNMIHAKINHEPTLDIGPLYDDFAPVEKYAQALLKK